LEAPRRLRDKIKEPNKWGNDIQFEFAKVGLRGWFMVFNTTFNNISVISLPLLYMVKKKMHVSFY
jgi:hypothetical protein